MPPRRVQPPVEQPEDPGADTGQDPQDPVQGGGDTEGDEFKPTEPKFGGLNKIDSNKWAAWTGGKPKADWTGLETPSPTYINAKQYRPTSISSQSKAQYYRVEGLTPKFGRDKDLQVFQRKVLEKLVDYGMDTTAYMPDPSDKAKVILVITGKIGVLMCKYKQAPRWILPVYAPVGVELV